MFLMQMKNKPEAMDPSQFWSGAANRSRRLNTHMLYSFPQLEILAHKLYRFSQDTVTQTANSRILVHHKLSYH